MWKRGELAEEEFEVLDDDAFFGGQDAVSGRACGARRDCHGGGDDVCGGSVGVVGEGEGEGEGSLREGKGRAREGRGKGGGRVGEG